MARKESRDLSFELKGNIYETEDDIIKVQTGGKSPKFDEQHLQDMFDEIREWLVSRLDSDIEMKITLKETSDGKLGE